jgi:hypothetical protein
MVAGHSAILVSSLVVGTRRAGLEGGGWNFAVFISVLLLSIGFLVANDFFQCFKPFFERIIFLPQLRYLRLLLFQFLVVRAEVQHDAEQSIGDARERIGDRPGDAAAAGHHVVNRKFPSLDSRRRSSGPGR